MGQASRGLEMALVLLRGGPWCSGRGVKIWGEVGTARIDTLSRRSHAGQEMMSWELLFLSQRMGKAGGRGLRRAALLSMWGGALTVRGRGRGRGSKDLSHMLLHYLNFLQ